MKAVGLALLVAGYPVAVGVLTRLVPVLRQRRWQWFVALEVATTCIVVGWWAYGRAAPVVVNGIALVAFGVAWWVTGRGGRRRS